MKKHISTIFYEFVEEHGYTVDYIKDLVVTIEVFESRYVIGDYNWSFLLDADFVNDTMALKKIELDFLRKYRNKGLWFDFIDYASGLTWNELGETYI